MCKFEYLSVGNSEDPWCGAIAKFLSSEFPQAHSNTESRLEAVITAILASRQRRLGPAPGVEAQAKMYKIGRRLIQKGLPVPIFVPFGPKKPIRGEGVDIAELATLKALSCLQANVKQHYEPGINVVIRLEDATGLILEDGTPDLSVDMDTYCRDFVRLTHMLGYDEFISLRRETAVVSFDSFKSEVEELLPRFEKYLAETDGTIKDEEKLKPLREVNWNGIISSEMRVYLMSRYEKFHPHATVAERRKMMATYLTCALARYRIGMMEALLGNSDPSISVSFAPPSPDEAMNAPRVFYRAVPMNHSKMHIPPWRAKGILKIGKDDKIKMSVINWSDIEKCDLTEGILKVSNENETLSIRADYIHT
jgi:hypothetical protein